MENFSPEFTAMSLHKNREQELLAQADRERAAKSLREEIKFRIRRKVRINNNPVR